MKTRLLIVAVATALASHAQRILEFTNGSWNLQNNSVETDGGNKIITGFTEINPITGRLCPSFKITDVAGNPLNSFYVDYPDKTYLMDFTFSPNNQSIILTGMIEQVSPSTPYKMFVTEVTLTGAPIQSFLESSSLSLIPHQVIYSANNNQVVVVGTQVTGILTSSNTLTIPKSGFVLNLNATNLGTINYRRNFDTPHTASNDADMLESITEVQGIGYFITGSGNHPNLNVQSLVTMGLSAGGANIPMYTKLYIDPNTQRAGASVMFSAANNLIYLLMNNSALQNFELIGLVPGTGNPGTGIFHYPINGIPAGTISVNGFRLQETNANQILVGGYIYCTTATILPNLLTPYQMIFVPTLNAVVNCKYFQSGNNTSPTPAYFAETGTSVYINTPDMIVYNPSINKAFLVSQNSSMGGYDHDIASLLNQTSCEIPIKVLLTPGTVPQAGSFTPVAVSQTASVYMPNGPNRPMNQNILCAASAPLAPFTGSLSPNPATDRVKVELSTVIHDITVIDLKGNKVIHLAPATRSESAMIDISGLTTGMYVVLITDADGNAYRERFVKE